MPRSRERNLGNAAQRLPLLSLSLLLVAGTLVLAGLLPVAQSQQPRVGYFLHDAPFQSSGRSSSSIPSDVDVSWLDGFSHFRLLPGDFKNGSIGYHFDGLASVLKLQFSNGGKEVTYMNRPFDSIAQTQWDKCAYEASGSSHVGGFEPCLRNPAVNLLPIAGQLWLTIDTYLWGRMDPDTLSTVFDANVDVDGVTLNAHPACDHNRGTCYVQHPCPVRDRYLPRTGLACVSKLEVNSGADAGKGGMKAQILHRAELPHDLNIQHSHEPCVTPNWVVSKLDSFEPHDPFNQFHGLLRTMEQKMDNMYMLWHRSQNVSYIVQGGPTYVNNHFGNCVEDELGNIIVDAVPATSDYLFSYFASSLAGPAHWEKILRPPYRCVFSPSAVGGATTYGVNCSNLLTSGDPSLIFDYPTFNPLWKMNPASRFLYGCSQVSTSESKWFDRIIKMDTKQGKVIASWAAPNVFVTEADFIGNPETSGTVEDDGVLFSLAYNSTSNESFFVMLDAKDLHQIGTFPMNGVYPFHAHGISCNPQGKCFTNP